MKLDPETVRLIERALEDLRFGEIIIVVHAGRIHGVDVKSRRRITAVDNSQSDRLGSK